MAGSSHPQTNAVLYEAVCRLQTVPSELDSAWGKSYAMSGCAGGEDKPPLELQGCLRVCLMIANPAGFCSFCI